MSDEDIIRVPRARLQEVKREIDGLQAERARLLAELDAMQAAHRTLAEEHENLRAHLTGSIRELARLRGE